MGQRNWYIALSLEAAACLLLVALLGWNSGEGRNRLPARPPSRFAQIGLGAAVAVPVRGGGQRAGHRDLCAARPDPADRPGGALAAGRLRRADALLAVLSALLFWVLYLMVNPGLLTAWLNLAAGGDRGPGGAGGRGLRGAGRLAGAPGPGDGPGGAGAGQLLWGGWAGCWDCWRRPLWRRPSEPPGPGGDGQPEERQPGQRGHAGSQLCIP